jgi:anti-sigma B factor antagonist
MDISEEKTDGVMTVGLKGRLDALSAKTVEERLLRLITAGETRLVIDLGEVGYISSIGLRVLLIAAKRLKTAKGQIGICAMQPPIKKVFDIAGFTALFKIFATREEAVQALS